MTTPPKMEHCALTPQQEKLWDSTRVALIWHCPAFSHIFYSMMDKSGSKYIAMFTHDVPIAATDGSNLLLNPDRFFKYNLMERVYICAHEIMHCIWDHLGMMHRFSKSNKIGYPDGKSLPFDQMVFNIATDLVINDTLIASKIGAYNKEWLHDEKIATHKDSSLDAYRKLFKMAQAAGAIGVAAVVGAGNGMPGVNGQGFDQHLPPGASQGKDPTQADQSRSKSEWQTQVAAGMAIEKATMSGGRGKDRGALWSKFEELLNPQVDWREKIQALFARKIGSGSYDWRRPDRHLIVQDIYAPGRSGFGAEAVVVACDTSGSIGGKQIDMFLAEVSGILDDVKPKRLFLLWCDTDIQRVDECDDPSDLNEIRSKGAPGRGGTSFIPVFDWVTKQGITPDALVYLTDGLGPFPSKAPKYPVIWGNILPSSKYPFGDVVDLPVTNA